MNIEFLNLEKMKKELKIEEQMLKNAFSKWDDFIKNKEKFSIPSAVNHMMKEESAEVKAKVMILIAAILLELDSKNDAEQDINYIT